MVLEYEVASFSWENDTMITNFGPVVCFLGHILWTNVETQNFPFQHKLGVNEWHFGCP